ncbi:baseplate J/gp47 family protein [Treponema phagedenis]|uniref:baseplate J/gp47 family protein n=2 Tax=Treponema phagedenis TaxID=162 RepID=UPI0001F642D9|nr:baseplate J/gp47 family protein [Treponema phagedenis]EFW38939.1 hypothetical protein HMPREF9554_00549 [Treponema phagedenis F0421]QEK03671.1 hypothetical protein FUT83_07545 [Treponema phagedenis]QEK09288.1 hypothetical protein FUT81_07455 [Treponema phagedenis]TYT77835.1 hypothetical protein FS559_01175 [Treponema phagedenis]TYT78042.1 hypothetical protein FS559_02325 [Treponema phagedenis]
MDFDYKIKTFDEIYTEMQLKVFGKILTATDANSGSVLCSLLEATARLIAEAYLHCQIGYAKYLQDLVEGAFGVKRLLGTKAKGKVVFFTEKGKPAASHLYIAVGTEIACGDTVFVTTESGMIDKGTEQSKPIFAEAKEIGEKGNVPSESVDTILSGLHSSIAGVKNIRPFENGTSAETDPELRKRFVNYLRGLQRTNFYGVKEAALSTKAYHVNVVLCAPPKDIPTRDFDGNPVTEHNVNCAVYVCDKEGECSGALLDEVRKTLRGDGTYNNPGYTPAGVHLAVAPIVADRRFQGEGNKLNLEIFSVLPDKEEAKERVRKKVIEFFQGFEVGQSLIITDLILAVRQFDWVTDVIIKDMNLPQGSANPSATESHKLLVVKEEDVLITIKQQG